ncbi:MAG: PH domain-containing protein [Nitrospiraceae bacterium]
MQTDETVRWSAYPSWAHFTWLYCFSLVAGGRCLLALWWGMSGWEMWLGGAMALLLCAAVLRRWAQYCFTSRRVIVKNGYTGRDLQALALDAIADVTVNQGPIAQFFDIGTVVIKSASEDRVLSLRGVREPEVIKTRIDALRTK